MFKKAMKWGFFTTMFWIFFMIVVVGFLFAMVEVATRYGLGG